MLNYLLLILSWQSNCPAKVAMWYSKTSLNCVLNTNKPFYPSFHLSLVEHTCLQSLHLLQWVDLLPQLLDLGLHVVSLCRCIPTEKHPHTSLVNRGVKTFGKSHICGLCARYLQPDWVKSLFWCGMDVRSWAEAKRSRGGGRRGGPGAPWLWILHDGTQGFTLCCCGRN